MSIFPKRTLRGTAVTIHWNFNTSAITDVHVCPFVRIGVKDPNGKVTLLFEKHVMALPAVKDIPQDDEPAKPIYLNKNFPLLVVAEYLSGRYSREKLIDILENIQAGRHFYFVYQVEDDAPLGKYTLVSEVISGGEIRHSKTAEDDFFFVENISITHRKANDNIVEATLVNHSPEATPVKVIGYHANGQLLAEHINAYELNGLETKSVRVNAPYAFVSYNEEREVLPLYTKSRVVQNPYYLGLEKENRDFIIHRENESAFILDKVTKQIWDYADGLEDENIMLKKGEPQFKEMLESGLIYIIDEQGAKTER